MKSILEEEEEDINEENDVDSLQELIEKVALQRKKTTRCRNRMR